MGRARRFPLQSPYQSALSQGHSFLFTPANGTVGTGTGFGMSWTSSPGGVGPPTVAHPAPSSAGPAVVSQMKRTRWSSVVTTANQVCGVGYANAEDAFMWRGNAAGLGGFYVSFRFVLANWTTNDRIFVGLSDSTTSQAASDTLAGNLVGLWHAAADPDTGTNRLNILTRDGSSSTKTNIPGAPNLQDALGFDFELFAKPNDTNIYWALLDYNADAVYDSGVATLTLPTNTVFMGPHCAGSNAANSTALDMQFAISKIYGHAHY